MKRQTDQEPEAGPRTVGYDRAPISSLRVGSGPQFVALVQGSGPAAFRPHVGFGVEDSAPDQIIEDACRAREWSARDEGSRGHDTRNPCRFARRSRNPASGRQLLRWRRHARQPVWLMVWWRRDGHSTLTRHGAVTSPSRSSPGRAETYADRKLRPDRSVRNDPVPQLRVSGDGRLLWQRLHRVEARGRAGAGRDSRRVKCHTHGTDAPRRHRSRAARDAIERHRARRAA